jgi:hypothetical protein
MMRSLKSLLLIAVLTFLIAYHSAAQSTPLTIGVAQVGSASDWRTAATLVGAEARYQPRVLQR